jgi:hypothetical protein
MPASTLRVVAGRGASMKAFPRSALIVIHKFILDETPKLKFGLRSPKFILDDWTPEPSAFISNT